MTAKDASESDAGRFDGIDDGPGYCAALFEHVDDPILAVGSDPRPHVVAVNPEFETTFGAAPGAGRPIADLDRPDVGQAERSLVGSVRAGASDRERVRRRTDRGERTFDVRAVPADAPDLDGFLIYRDVTDRVVRDQQLAVLRRALRHDLRNDLTAVLGYARAARRTAEEPETREALETMLDATEDLRRLANSADGLRSVTEADERSSLHSSLARARRGVDDAAVRVDGPDRDACVEARVEVALGELCRALAAPAEVTRVDLRATVDDAAITVRAVADGALPPQQRSALAGEEETPLRHASGIGPWLVRWGVRNAGGAVEVLDCGPDRTAVSVTVPTLDAPVDPVVAD